MNARSAGSRRAMRARQASVSSTAESARVCKRRPALAIVSEPSSSSVIAASVHGAEEIELHRLHVDRVEPLDALVECLEDGGEVVFGREPGPAGEDLSGVRSDRRGRGGRHGANLLAASRVAAMGWS